MDAATASAIAYAIGFTAVPAATAVVAWKSPPGKAIRKAVSKHRKERIAAERRAEADAKAAQRLKDREDKAAARKAEREAAKAERAAAKGGKRKPRPSDADSEAGALKVAATATAAAPTTVVPGPAASTVTRLERVVGATGRGVRATNRGVRAGWRHYTAGTAAFTAWSHPRVAGWLRVGAAKAAEKNPRRGGVRNWAAGKLHPPPSPAATQPAPGPSAPSPTHTSGGRHRAPPGTAAAPADPTTRLLGGKHTMGDILVPDKRVQAVIEAIGPLCDFAPSKQGGAWELEDYLLSLTELIRILGAAVAFNTSTLDGQRWDPEVVNALYAVSVALAADVPTSYAVWEKLRQVYAPDFAAAETGGRRRVDDHQSVFDPDYANAG